MNPRQPLPHSLGLEATAFSPTSRYYGLPVLTTTRTDGREVAYVERRLVPSPERFVAMHEYGIVFGDRLDLLAHRFLGDPEQFWRLCDANGALHPVELTAEVGRRLRITLPEGIQGAS